MIAWIRRCGAAALLVCFLGFPASLSAHPVPFSYLDFRVGADRIESSIVLHLFDVAHELGVEPVESLLDPAVLDARADAVIQILRERLRVAADGRALMPRQWSAPELLPERQSLAVRVEYESPGAPGILSVTADLFPYDPQHQSFLNFYEDGRLMSQAILARGSPSVEYFTGTPQGTFAVVRKFVPEGVHHILIGPDHILFLVGLLLVGGTLRQLLLVVTGFTIAHSITLSLAALNILNPPARFIEPAIALSIVYVGADNLLVRDGRDVRGWIAFAFGFIHGFGFANVLRDMNLPTQALGWSLFSFNLGVEIGQMFVVVIVASTLAAVRARNEVAGRYLLVGGSVGVMIAGAFWFIQRVFFSGGMA
ncbi:MAG: HupE/UreJ family protein [Vicinamibacterales bacterium]